MTTLFLILFFSIFHNGYAQDDNILWASARLQHSIDDQWSAAFRPIVRYVDNISDYNDFSTDLSVRYTIDQHWSVQFLDRHWFVQDATDRHFLWLDLLRKDQLSTKWSLSNQFRLHYAIDIRDRVDPDLIRWDALVKYKINRVTPFVGYEIFYRIDDPSLNRVRWQLGVSYPLAPQLKMINTLWFEDFSKDAPDSLVWGFILQYTIP